MHRFTRRGEPLPEFGSGHADVRMSRPGRGGRCIVRPRRVCARRRSACSARRGRCASQTLARRFQPHRLPSRRARGFRNRRHRSLHVRRQRGFITRGCQFTDCRDGRHAGRAVRVDRHHHRCLGSPCRRRRDRRLINRIARRGAPVAMERMRARQAHRAQHEACRQRQQRRLPATASGTWLHPWLVVRAKIGRTHGSGYWCLARAMQIEYARPRPLALHKRRAPSPERRRQLGEGPRKRQREMSGDVLHTHDVGDEPSAVRRTDSRY